MRASSALFVGLSLVLGCGAPGAVTGSACGVCGANASCLAQADGTKRCACDAGFSGDGRTCQAATDPKVCASCSADAACLLQSGRTVCQCHSGFSGNGQLCRAVLDPSACGGCASDATCEKAPDGTPRCRCPAGLAGDGHACHQPVDCDDDHGGCHRFATCTLSASAPRCSCAFGTTGDGYLCLPPAGEVLRLKGDLNLTYAPSGGGACQASWTLDVPLASYGQRYTATAHGSVWDATATVTLTDPEQGAFDASVLLHLTQNVGQCAGDFTFAAGTGGTSVPDTLPLSIVGVPVPWSWSTADGATITSFSGQLGASFTP